MGSIFHWPKQMMEFTALFSKLIRNSSKLLSSSSFRAPMKVTTTHNNRNSEATCQSVDFSLYKSHRLIEFECQLRENSVLLLLLLLFVMRVLGRNCLPVGRLEARGVKASGRNSASTFETKSTLIFTWLGVIEARGLLGTRILWWLVGVRGLNEVLCTCQIIIRAALGKQLIVIW